MKTLKFALFVVLALTPLWLLGAAIFVASLFPGPFPN